MLSDVAVVLVSSGMSQFLYHSSDAWNVVEKADFQIEFLANVHLVMRNIICVVLYEVGVKIRSLYEVKKAVVRPFF